MGADAGGGSCCCLEDCAHGFRMVFVEGREKGDSTRNAGLVMGEGDEEEEEEDAEDNSFGGMDSRFKDSL